MASRKGRTPRRPPFDPTRRRFLAGVAAATGALALPGCGAGPEGEAVSADARVGEGALPDPAESGIDHIVQVMMENRSYDHFLGWVPKSDGIQKQTFVNNAGERVATFHMGNDAPEYGFQGCGWGDPNHGYEGGRIHLNHGAMDGFLKTVGNPADKFPAGYYNADDLLFYKGVAEHFTICDRYFHGILTSTFPNRIYIHAGQTDRLNNAFYPGQDEGEPPTPSSLPTIWDRLAAKGISGKNYFSDAPITAFWGDKYADISAPFEQFLIDAAAGRLPAVSYFDPFFGGAGAGESPAGVSRDDHPQADVRDGQAARADWSNNMAIALNFKNPPNLDAPAFGQASPGGLPANSRGPSWGSFCDEAITQRLPIGAPMSAAQREWLEHQNELRPLYDMAKLYGLI